MEETEPSEMASEGTVTTALGGASRAILAPAVTVSDVDTLSLRMLQRSLGSEADSKVSWNVRAEARWNGRWSIEAR